MLGERRQRLPIDGVESLVLGAERGVGSSGRLRQPFQGGFIEARFDQMALVVFQETTALIGWQRNELGVRGSHANREDLKSVLGRSLRRC